jgi:kynureninase
MINEEELYRSPNALAPFYSRFRVSDLHLLTGHSHQAWPDCSLQGQIQAWIDASEHTDKKWQYALEKAERVKEGFSRLLDDERGHIALGPSTHDVLIRFLSALPLLKRPRIVTTDGEFHTIRRQLDRLAEEGIEIVKVPSHPASSTAERLIEACTDRTAVVMVSSVFFRSGHIVRGLSDVLETCRKLGAEFLVDVYHSLNVVPFSLKQERLDGAYVVGGGYKYCQLGEGNCFLRFPQDCEMRPIVTGWFSEYDALAVSQEKGLVVYGKGSARFAGSTYDPTSHYRAAEVFRFFSENGLEPELLRRVSQHQIGLLANLFDEMDRDPALITRDRSAPLSETGGFLVLQSSRSGEISQLLFDRGVFTDFRGSSLRFGPAPYLSDQQLREAMDALNDVLDQLKR